MSFIPSGEVDQTQAPNLPNTPFFPEISPDNFRKQHNVDDTVARERLEHALQNSIIEVNRELAEWRFVQESLGHTTLSDTSDVAFSGETEINQSEYLYIAAVYHLSKSRILEQMRNFDGTGAGHNRADALSDPIDTNRREARRAVRAIMGQTGTVVELI